MRFLSSPLLVALGLTGTGGPDCHPVNAAEPSASPAARITVRLDQPGHPISRYLTGACLEDVNHEVYGGLSSQMLFGESLQEPAPGPGLPGFQTFGGAWEIRDGELEGSGGDGPKLIAPEPTFLDGAAGVDVWLSDAAAGNAGLIVRVVRPGLGADNFDGYEISLDAAAQVVRLGRHRHNWTLIRDTPWAVPTGRWIALEVRMEGAAIEVWVDRQLVIRHREADGALPAGVVGLRQWQRSARYRELWVAADGLRRELAFRPPPVTTVAVSGPWHWLQRGEARGAAALIPDRPFVGHQSQRLLLADGAGEIGIENQGLNRTGLHLVGEKPYEGVLWARPADPAHPTDEIWVGLESADGRAIRAERRLTLMAPARTGTPGDWQRLAFTLTPKRTEPRGRFVVKLKRPGAVDVGYALLQPGAWGRFRKLPVRRDVAEALIDQGVTVLRYGGSMINHPAYRWKNMIGPREQRPPTPGTWYTPSSNGWGIADFLNFCEAAGFLAIPALNVDETPQDFADFIEYVNGPAASTWGRRRVADGHPQPYRLRHIELGNEEKVDLVYAAKFQALAEAAWARDPALILVVGDFVYSRPVRDPQRVEGAASGITNLAGQQAILRLARERGREVWFDLHVGTDGPEPDETFGGMFTFLETLGRIAEGAAHRVAVFEFNAGNHQHRRALANALAIQAIERDGRIPVATSANCLQPDGQNDNGWDQGLLFLNPRQVWLQPPGWVTRMISRHYQPRFAPAAVDGTDLLDVSAKRSEDGRQVVVGVVNRGARHLETVLELAGVRGVDARFEVEELAAALDARNTADAPRRIVPEVRSMRRPEGGDGRIRWSFRPHSFTVLEFRTDGLASATQERR